MLVGTVVVAVLAAAGPVSGDTATADRARTMVTGWLRAEANPLHEAMGPAVTTVESHSATNGIPLFHVVNLAGGGFVIVPADDLVEPIVAFAPQGGFDPSPCNPLAAMLQRDLPQRLAAVRGVKGAAVTDLTAQAKSKWTALLSLAQSDTGIMPAGISSVTDVRVAPLIQAMWNQQADMGSIYGNACYNYYAPPYAAGTASNYPCGCVATAMAQLMRYWMWPATGVGTAAFTITVDGISRSRNLRGGNGTGGAYVWTNMVFSPMTDSTLAQRQAIGALCSDAGVAVNMQYTAAGSGAALAVARYQLISVFKYANVVYGFNQEDNIGAGLNGMITPNLDLGCPVLLGIQTLAGSIHAVVCDGYGYSASTLYHHLNLGWSGSYTAWYNLPLIQAGGYTFDIVNECLYNIWTNGTGEIISGRIVDKTGSPLSGVTVTAAQPGGATFVAVSNTNGIYALGRLPSSTTYALSASRSGYNFFNQITNTGVSLDSLSTSGNRWGVNFRATDAPAPFTATSTVNTQVNLSWVKNLASDSVLVAWNTNGTFGTPSGTYAVGASIPGGGIVLYTSDGSNTTHTGLTGGVTYYYTAWSVHTGPSYSTGAVASVTTPKVFQAVTFPAIADQIVTNHVALTASASSGLTVGFAVLSGPALLSEGSNLTFTGAGTVSVMALQGGDTYWGAASWTNTFRVRGLYTLTIQSPWGTTQPAAGTWTNLEGTASTNTVSSPVTAGGTQYVCTGWSMTGNAPVYGVSNTFAMTLTNNATLAWSWRTNYWLHIDLGGPGTVSTNDAWIQQAAITQVTASNGAYYAFGGWRGQTNNSSTTSNRITFTMNASRTLLALFNAVLATNTVPHWWLARYNLTNFNADAMLDQDHDRMATWQEWQAGTDPTNPRSVFRMASMDDNGTQGLVFCWPSVTDRVYTLYMSTNLTGASNAFSVVPGATNMPGFSPETRYTNASPDTAPVFFKVEVHP